MAIGTAATVQQLQLEALNEQIRLLIETESQLDKRISERGSVTPVSLRSFRVRFQTSLPGNVSAFNLDGGVLPTGSFSAWDQGTITPTAWVIPVEYSRLTAIIGEGGAKVVSENPVAKTLADVALQMAKQRDQFLQTGGTGQLATVDASYAGGGANPIVLQNLGFGARLLSQQQTVQVFSSALALRGTCTIQLVNSKLGNTQTIQVDAVPAGTIAGDFIMVGGVAASTPSFVNGIPYFHNTATTGNYLGISRSNPYVVANGVNANAATISLPALRAAMNRVVQSLGAEGAKGQVWHTHPSQKQAYEEMGFAIQEIMMSNGKMPGYDGLTASDGDLKVAGREVISNLHADNSRWDFMDFNAWLKVTWGKAPFWFKNRSGQYIFQNYDPTTGNPTANESCYFVDARNYACDQPQGLSSVTNCKLPVFN